MKIKVLASNIEKSFKSNDYIEEYILEYDENTTIGDMKKILNIENCNINFSKYHYQPVNTYLIDQIIPYIEINEKIYFDVDLIKVRIVDIIKTFEITEVLEFDYNINGIGGGHVALEILKNVVKAAEIFANMKDVIEFVKYINNSLLKDKKITNKKFLKKHNSFSVFSYIYSDSNWNHYILAEKMNIDKKGAKNLLKILGYKWDNSKKIYSITEEEKENQMDRISYIELELARKKEEKEMRKMKNI